MDYIKLLELVKDLKYVTTKRGSKQGLIIYDFIINNINSNNVKDHPDIFNKLYVAINGIESHGYFTSKEFNIVNKIRDLIESYQ